MGITKIARETLSIQDSVSCDYFRTPVKYQGVDIFVFVGDIHGFSSKPPNTISGVTQQNKEGVDHKNQSTFPCDLLIRLLITIISYGAYCLDRDVMVLMLHNFI